MGFKHMDSTSVLSNTNISAVTVTILMVMDKALSTMILADESKLQMQYPY